MPRGIQAVYGGLEMRGESHATTRADLFRHRLPQETPVRLAANVQRKGKAQGMEELLEILRAMASKKGEVDDQQELFLDMAERAVRTVAPTFGSGHDEIAILMLSVDRDHLRFVAPRKFSSLGTIPMSKRDSIAVSVLTKKVGQTTNNVPTVRHVSFFESIKIKDRPFPIQKMITAPIFAGSEAVGVIQISRKGETPRDAGPDFTGADLKKLQDLFSRIGPELIKGRPDRY